MPSQTFYNLESKKRTKFIKTSFKEFSTHDYNTASISEIVRKLGIAKGSVYQYFKNKKDLFYYLIDLSLEEKEMFFEGSDELNSARSFTNWYKLRVQAKLKFDKEKSMFSNLLSNFYLQRNNSELRPKYLHIRNQEYLLFEESLKKFSKSFRSGIDIEKVAALMMELEVLIPEFPEISAGKKVPSKSKSADHMEDISEGFIEILKGGVLKGKK